MTAKPGGLEILPPVKKAFFAGGSGVQLPARKEGRRDACPTLGTAADALFDDPENKEKQADSDQVRPSQTMRLKKCAHFQHGAKC